MALAQHSAYYLTGRLASAVVGILALYAFTRVLNPADYGRYSVIMAVAGLVSAVGFQWLRQCLVKFGPDPTCDRGQLLGSIGVLFLALLATTVTAAALFAGFNSRPSHIVSTSLVAATVLLACAQAWFELGLDANRVDLNPVRYGLVGSLRAILCLAFGLLAVWVSHALIALISGLALGYLVASLLAAPRWLGGLARLQNANWARTRTLAAYGLPLALTLGFSFIIDSTDRLMLAAMRGPVEAGVYSSAYSLTQYALNNLLSALGLAVFPLAVKCYAEYGADRTKVVLGQNLLLTVGLALPATLGLVVLAPTLTRLLLGNFVPGQSPLIAAIVAVGVCLAGIRSNAYDIVFMITEKTKQQAALLGAAAGVNVLLNIIFIPLWGAIGAATAMLMSYMLALAVSVLLGRRLIQTRFERLDLIKIITASGVMLAVVALPPAQSTWPSLALRVTSGVAVYLCAILALNPVDVRTRIRGVGHWWPA